METVISRIEMVLLGIIARKPSYAYEIDQFIESAHMRRWVRIGSASVYQGLARLEDKGLAVSRREQEGRMPPRKRYSITAKGKRALAGKTQEMLAVSEDHYLDLNLGIFCADSLPTEEVLQLLAKRIESLARRYCEIERHACRVGGERLWQQDAILRVILALCHSEKDLLKDLVKELHNSEGTHP